MNNSKDPIGLKPLAIRSVGRAHLACLRCRSQKIKCSGGKPLPVLLLLKNFLLTIIFLLSQDYLNAGTAFCQTKTVNIRKEKKK